MLVWDYAEKLRNEVRNWLAAGLIDQTAAQQLIHDIDQRQKKRSFANVLAIFGGVLLAAGLIAFVASNWDGMPRYLRVVVLVAAIWFSYAASIFTKLRNHPYLSDIFLMVGIVAFGASIMLIGQIYQLQGRNEDALLVWMIGGLLTVLGTRSISALATTILVSCAWMVSEHPVTDTSATVLNIGRFYWFPLVWLVLAAIAKWVGSRFCAHLLAVLLIVWLILIVWVGWEPAFDRVISVQAALLILGAMVLASHSTQLHLAGFEIHALGYCFIALLGLEYLVFADISLSKDKLFLFDGWRTYSPMALAVLLTGGLVLLMRRSGISPTRDQYVFCVIAALCLFKVFAFKQQELFGELGLSIISAGVGLVFAIWSVRFGWRIGSRVLSALGYIGFITVLLITYARVFGTLEFTAAVYGAAGVILLGVSIWLFRKDQSKTEQER